MRRMLFLLLIALCMLPGGCARDPLAPIAASGSPEIPAPAVSDLPRTQRSATLWFRFGTEPLLAAETREFSAAPQDIDALLILQALLEGPGAAGTELQPLFPQGTRVLAVQQSGRLMFVTLSRHIMNGFADEPDDWRAHPVWAEEVPLRRRLAMQSIAATLTENFGVDQVVILVEQSATVTDSLRLRNAYYTLDGDTTLAEPLMRDEALLLTPARTAEVILQCWQECDWARLYRYIARNAPFTGMTRPDEDAFIQQMAAEKRLLYAEAAGGSVSLDGKEAVFTLRGAFLQDGQAQPFSGMVLRLTREKGIWRVDLSQLTGREALP